jgi:hypothetical protein
VNMKFTCAGGISGMTVTGSIIGHIEDSDCNSYQSSHSFVFQQGSPGHQKFTQATTTGTVLDLLSTTKSGGPYSTTSLTGTGTITYYEDKVNITC